MIKGCQRAALGEWWGCSSEGRYSFHARTTSWTPPCLTSTFSPCLLWQSTGDSFSPILLFTEQRRISLKSQMADWA